MRRIFVFSALTLLFFSGEALAQEKSVTGAERQSLEMTVYQDDLALITDRRRVDLVAGANTLAFLDVSSRLRPESAALRSVSAGAIAVREMRFDFDLLTPEALLQRHLGRTVGVVSVNPATGEETQVEAHVLSVDGGVVLRIGERIETQVPGRIVFPEVPAGLRALPTLAVDLDADAPPRPHELELRYLSTGFSWRSDYVAELSADGRSLDVSGWITLVNGTKTRFPDTRVQFVAGDVHRVRNGVPFRAEAVARDLMVAAPAVQREELFDYHLYTLDRPVTLEPNQVRQVNLVSAEKVPAKREYLLYGQEFYYRGRHAEIGRNLPVAIFVEFVNDAGAGLGVPLPRGVVRVYQPDARGRAQFIGEDTIGHTPRGETLRLNLGNAFDLRADRIQTDFRRLPAPEREQRFESAFRIAVRNAGDRDVTVTVVEPMPGDWEIVQESHPHEKRSAREALWRIGVPAGGETVLEYRAQVRF